MCHLRLLKFFDPILRFDGIWGFCFDPISVEDQDRQNKAATSRAIKIKDKATHGRRSSSWCGEEKKSKIVACSADDEMLCNEDDDEVDGLFDYYFWSFWMCNGAIEEF